MIGVSAAFVLAGFAWPGAADLLVRLFGVTFAIWFLVSRAFHAMETVVTTQELGSPFEKQDTMPRRPSAPEALLELAIEVKAANDEQSAADTRIPASVERTVRREASRRLAEHHGLLLSDPSHHDRIRLLISGATWDVIRPRRLQIVSTDREPVVMVALRELAGILDDVEKL